MDILLKNPSFRKKKKVIAPLVLTYNPGNPPMKNWIKNGLEHLHQDPEMKELFPSIDVIFRQDRNLQIGLRTQSRTSRN